MRYFIGITRKKQVKNYNVFKKSVVIAASFTKNTSFDVEIIFYVANVAMLRTISPEIWAW